MIGHRASRTLAIAASIAMAAAVIAGLVVLGSPAHQRHLRLDRKRVKDLGMLNTMISLYWQQHQTLPPDLKAVDAGRYLGDPVSGEPFGYVVTGKRSYRLCARFDLPSDPEDTGVFSTHPSGQHCIDRTVGAP